MGQNDKTGPSTVNGAHNSITKENPRQHPTYWFKDGSLLIQVQSNIYRIHGSLLDRHSPVISTLARSSNPTYDLPQVHIPEERGVSVADFEVLLEHLYHDIPLGFDTPFYRVASLLRVSSEHQLHFPSINTIARYRFQHMFSKSLDDFTHSDEADRALALAVQYNLYPVQKGLYYNVATHFHFEDDGDGGEENPTETSQGEDQAQSPQIPPDLAQKCKQLLDHLIAHFTPVLFTVATAGHMECTDVFAELWMPLVISPALGNNGLCKPLETLQTIIDLDWKEHGLCGECVQSKREEWKGEQKEVWDRLDSWLGLDQTM